MLHTGTARLCLILALLGTLAFFGACGKAEKGTRIIIDDPTRSTSGHNLYSEAGGLGGTTAWVNVGEFAELLDERKMGVDSAGAVPGVWVKVRTFYNPREGWIQEEHIRPAASR